MSYTEYHIHRISEFVKKTTEWSDGKPDSYLLSILKSWVDKGTSNSIGQISSENFAKYSQSSGYCQFAL